MYICYSCEIDYIYVNILSVPVLLFEKFIPPDNCVGLNYLVSVVSTSTFSNCLISDFVYTITLLLFTIHFVYHNCVISLLITVLIIIYRNYCVFL